MEIFPLLSYYFRRHGAHGLHSPFVFEWYNACVTKRPARAETERIEEARKKFSRNHSLFVKQDFGTGKNNRQMRVSRLVKDSMDARMGEILFQTIRYMNYRQVLELGTCLGIGTAYLNAGGAASVVSVEGCPATKQFASQFLAEAHCTEPTLLQGEFSEVLQSGLRELKNIDLVHVDGNHRGEATLEYYRQLRPKMSDNGLMVFDDIRWSKEMWHAWREIASLEKNCYSIDLGTTGMVFLCAREYGQYFYMKK